MILTCTCQDWTLPSSEMGFWPAEKSNTSLSLSALLKTSYKLYCCLITTIESWLSEDKCWNLTLNSPIVQAMEIRFRQFYWQIMSFLLASLNRPAVPWHQMPLNWRDVILLHSQRIHGAMSPQHTGVGTTNNRWSYNNNGQNGQMIKIRHTVLHLYTTSQASL